MMYILGLFSQNKYRNMYLCITLDVLYLVLLYSYIPLRLCRDKADIPTINLNVIAYFYIYSVRTTNISMTITGWPYLYPGDTGISMRRHLMMRCFIDCAIQC